MSAWIVSKAHIDCLVQSLVTEGIIEMEAADRVGRDLWRENHRSVNFRYGEKTRTPSYRFEGVESPLDDDVVHKQVRCYNYQTCEHGGYEASRSYRLVTQLGKILTARRGTDEMSDAAPWGIDRLEQALPQRSNTEATR